MAYTPEFRTEAVRLYRLGGRGVKAAAHQINVALFFAWETDRRR